MYGWGNAGSDLGTWVNNPFLQGVEEGADSSLGLVVAVVQQGVLLGAPALLVGDAPNGNAHALLDLEAGVHNGKVVVGRSAGNVKLGNGDLLHVGGGEGLESGGSARSSVPTARGSQVRLGADAVNGDALEYV